MKNVWGAVSTGGQVHYLTFLFFPAGNHGYPWESVGSPKGARGTSRGTSHGTFRGFPRAPVSIRAVRTPVGIIPVGKANPNPNPAGLHVGAPTGCPTGIPRGCPVETPTGGRSYIRQIVSIVAVLGVVVMHVREVKETPPPPPQKKTRKTGGVGVSGEMPASPYHTQTNKQTTS